MSIIIGRDIYPLEIGGKISINLLLGPTVEVSAQRHRELPHQGNFHLTCQFS